MTWDSFKLGEIISIKHGYAFKGEFFSEEPTNDILLTPGNFKIGGGFKESKLKYYSGEIPLDYVISTNDVVVTMTDLSKMADTLGYSAKIPKDTTKTFLHNQRIGLVKLLTDKFDLGFIYWLMRAEHYQKFVAGSATGATVKHTSPSKIYAFKFKAPSNITTQQKIAQILSAYDDLIENNLKRIKLLEEMAQITYEQWFVRMKFPNHKTTPIDAETGLPEEWEILKVGNLLDKLKVTKKIKSSEYLEKGNTPIIDQSRKFIAGYTNEKDAVIESTVPVIVFGDHTRILKLITFTFARGADGTQLIKSKDKRIPQYQFYLALKVIDLSDYHYARHFKFLKESLVIVPTEEVAIKFEDRARIIFRNINVLREQNQHLKEARDILLPRLMTGIIDADNIKIPSLNTTPSESDNA